jgi:putative endonuclease
MLKCVSCRNKLSYVGYTKDLEKRLSLHNSGKGAKFTRGNNWKLIFKKKFITKNEAMSYEYILKNDKKKRKHIYNNSK